MYEGSFNLCCVLMEEWFYWLSLFAFPVDNINRVCLRPGGQKGSDYINASFIDVSKSKLIIAHYNVCIGFQEYNVYRNFMKSASIHYYYLSIFSKHLCGTKLKSTCCSNLGFICVNQSHSYFI